MASELELTDPLELARKVRLMFGNPGSIELRVKLGTKGGGRVMVRAAEPKSSGGLPRSDAQIDIAGSGSFFLLLDGLFPLSEVDDQPDIWEEILRDFIEIVEAYFGGAGEVSVRPRMLRPALVSLALKLEDRELLLAGRLGRRRRLRDRPIA